MLDTLAIPVLRKLRQEDLPGLHSETFFQKQNKQTKTGSRNISQRDSIYPNVQGLVFDPQDHIDKHIHNILGMNGCSTCRGTCLKAWQPVFNPQSPCKSGRRAPTHEQNFKRIILSEQGRRANFANTFPRGNFSNVYELSPHLLLFKTPLELNYQGVTFFEGELLL